MSQHAPCSGGSPGFCLPNYTIGIMTIQKKYAIMSVTKKEKRIVM